jgi:hypothetical protein
MQLVRTVLIVAALALLAGCAATGIKYSELKPSMPTLKPGEGRIYFFRSASMLGAAVQPDVKLNGTTVGTSIPGGFFFADRPAGNYEAHASTEVERKVTFTLGTGETKYIRTSPSFGVFIGRINFELANSTEAEAELPELSYTGETKK